jgi:uncharacterized protein (DUF433 family)
MAISLHELHDLLADLSAAEKAQVLQWIVRDLGDTFPGIESRPEVNGGEPCIVRTRIPIWTLVQARVLVGKRVEVKDAEPALPDDDLEARYGDKLDRMLGGLAAGNTEIPAT